MTPEIPQQEKELPQRPDLVFRAKRWQADFAQRSGGSGTEAIFSDVLGECVDVIEEQRAQLAALTARAEQADKKLAEVVKDRERLRSLQLPKDEQRLYDLVRFARGYLHDEGLITNEEYAALASTGASSARRLEGYDTLTQAKEAAVAALLVKEQENQTLRGLLQKARDTYPCNICGWPRPFDAEHNICKCCGYQPGYDDPAIYKWDGAWWSRSAEGKPQILLAMEAALARLTAYIAARRELFTRVVPDPDNDRLPIMLEARVNELDLLEAHLSSLTKEPQ